jgi:hypothetical protein
LGKSPNLRKAQFPYLEKGAVVSTLVSCHFEHIRLIN